MNSPILDERLIELAAAGLVGEESPGQYSFRHALMREAVYANLLVKERRQYHRAIAETIVALYGESLDPYLVDLSYHYVQAGIWDKALEYSRRAGDKAQAMYAPKEAIDHFTRAIEAGKHLPAQPLSPLYRERGHAYEISGNFDLARSDHESALHYGRQQSHRRSEWQALIDLGFLWASRDYAQTKGYLEQALALARAMDDQHILGHTLNRVGNWLLNTEEADRALEFHREALSLFEKLNDQAGLAETFDLLGLSSIFVGDWKQGIEYYKQAINIFRSLDDRVGLVSALASYSERGITDYNDYIIPSAQEHDLIIADAEESFRISRDIGWRSGEAYAQIVLGSLWLSRGEFDRATSMLEGALAVAREIGHRQWTALAHLSQSILFLNLFELDKAIEHIEQALIMAREIGSLIFVRQATGGLAIVLARRGDRTSLARAARLLDEVSKSSSSLASFGLRTCAYGRVELELARGQFERALDTIHRFILQVTAHDSDVIGAYPRLFEAKALAGLARLSEAQTILEGLLRLLPAETTRPLLWQVHLELGKLYQQQRRNAESRAQFESACSIIDTVAATISDEKLRDNFRRHAYAQVPKSSQPKSKRQHPPLRISKERNDKSRKPPGKAKTRGRKVSRGSSKT